MQISKIILVITILSSSFFSLAAHKTDNKIVGGEIVTNIDETNFAVSFNRSCGGSIIAAKWILTAAHCAPVLMRDITVGTLDSTDPNALKVKVKTYTIHPDFSAQTLENDYALVELDQELPLNGHNIEAIKIADKQFTTDGFQDPGVNTTVYGWGMTSESGNLSPEIRKVIVPIVAKSVANAPESYNGGVKESMLAAGLAAGGKDACQGDSGGPMVAFNAQNEPVLIGIVSWGIGCARENKYGVYSKVSHVEKWIQDTISAK